MDAVQFHSRISKQFDAHYHGKLFKERAAIWTAVLSKYLKPNDRVLDAGCGSGVLSFYIGELGHSVVGVDGSTEMINLCNEKLFKNPNVNIRFFVEMLPLGDSVLRQQFDLILSSSVLEYVADYHSGILSLQERLREAGTLIISMPNRKSVYRKLEMISYKLIKRPRHLAFVKNMRTPAEFREEMKSLDFDVVEVIQYSSTNFVNKMLQFLPIPEELSTTLFVAVCKRRSK